VADKNNRSLYGSDCVQDGVSIGVEADLIQRHWCAGAARQVDRDHAEAIGFQAFLNALPYLRVFECTVNQNHGRLFCSLYVGKKKCSGYREG